MKLKRPQYPDPVGTAGYFWVHAGHRETATNHAIEVVRGAATRELAEFTDDAIMTALAAPVGEWAVESLIQGAWMREYHEWEKATKSYFDGQHLRNGTAKPDWKGRPPGSNGAASHVDRVRAQLALFAATVSDSLLATLDQHRRLINAAKHEDEYFATEQDYRVLISAVPTSGTSWRRRRSSPCGASLRPCDTRPTQPSAASSTPGTGLEPTTAASRTQCQIRSES